jgi:hypothetical protein
MVNITASKVSDNNNCTVAVAVETTVDLLSPLLPSSFCPSRPSAPSSETLLAPRPATYAEAHVTLNPRNQMIDAKCFYSAKPRQFHKLQPREATST